MDWLQTLFAFLRQFWPLVIVQPWQEGLRITNLPWELRFSRHWPFWQKFEPEARIDEIGPGMHGNFPFLQEIKVESIKPQVMDLLPQTVMLKDQTQVSFSVNIGFEINSVLDNIMNIHLFRFSMEASSRVHLARRTREMATLQELIDKQKWLEDRLKDTLTTIAKDYGVKVLDVGFTDLSVSKTLRLLGDAQATTAAAIREEYD